MQSSLQSALLKAGAHNTIFLIKSERDATIYQEPHISLLCETLRQTFQRAVHGEKCRCLVVLQSQKELTIVGKILQETLCSGQDDNERIGVKDAAGHDGIVQFVAHWKAIWKDAPSKLIILTTSSSLLYSLCLGCMRLQDLQLVFLNSVTTANSNHPYCVAMDAFYGPALAKAFIEGVPAEAQLPRIVAIAEWPKVLAGETFQTKMNRMAKMRQYQRLFYAILVPCDFSPSQMKGKEDSPSLSPHSWMDMEELTETNALSSIFGKTKVVLFDDPKDHLRPLLQLIQEHPPNDDHNLIIIGDQIEQVENALQLAGLKGSLVQMQNVYLVQSLRNTILLVSPKEPALLSHALQCHISHAIVLESQPNLLASVLLMGLSKTIPLTFLCSTRERALHQQAIHMAVSVAAMAAVTPTNLDLTRDLRFLLGGFESLAKKALLIADTSPFHYRIPRTGATLIPPFTAILLLAICSYLPKIIEGKKPSRLDIRTRSVKRVDEHGRVIDKERHFYTTRITLPCCLSEFIPQEEMFIEGPLAFSRFFSQSTAAFIALKRMHFYNLLDDHFLPAQAVLDFAQKANALAAEYIPEDENVEGREGEGEGEGELEGEGALNSLPIDGNSQPHQIKELIATPLQYNNSWAELEKICGGSSKGPQHTFFVYIFECELGFFDGASHEDDLAALKLPLDTFIHMADLDFFNSANSGRTLALLLRNPIPTDLCPLMVPFSAGTKLRVRMASCGQIFLTEAEIERILEFQVFFFGAINLRQIFIDGPGGDDADIVEIPELHRPSIPNDKKMAYLVAFMKNANAGSLDRFMNMEDIFERYCAFVKSPKDNTIIMEGAERRGVEMEKGLNEKGKGINENHRQREIITNTSLNEWEIDWDLIGRAIEQRNYITLDEYRDRLFAFAEEKGGEGMSMPQPLIFEASPAKPPTKVDLVLFALRRLIVYTPYTGIFYRLKKWHSDLGPQSPFDSKSFPECKSYADYLRLRYGIHLKRPEKGGMAGGKRVENFGSLARWTLKSDATKTLRKKRELRSVLVPEAALVIPLPYAVLRMAMLFPRIVTDLDRQLLAIDFYTAKFNHLRSFLPSPPFLVQALTGPTAMTGYDFERMEVLGDSILKIYATIDVFITYCSYGEGQLTTRRQGIISNVNLYKQALHLDLPLYARLTGFVTKLFAPPEIRQLLDIDELGKRWPFVSQLFDDGEERWKKMHELDERADRRFGLFHLYPDGRLVDSGHRAQDSNRFSQPKRTNAMSAVTRFGSVVAPKSLADLIEALICAFYKGPGGLRGAMAFMVQIGLLSERMLDLGGLDSLQVAGRLINSHDGDENKYNITSPATLAIANPTEVATIIPPHVPDERIFPYEELERILGYSFTNRRLLFLACTHASVDTTFCNERLEWLGDAGIDWIVTRYYFEHFDDIEWMTPARITQSRQAAVCNEAFGRVVVRHGLHRFLRISSPPLQIEIENFAKALLREEQEGEKVQGEAGSDIMSKEGNSEMSVEMDRDHSEYKVYSFSTITDSLPPAPKALGDLLEAISGAILLDIHFDVERFERIFQPILQFHLDTRANPYDLPVNVMHDFWHDFRVAGLVNHTTFEYYTTQDESSIPSKEMILQAIGSSSPHTPSQCRIMVRGRVIAQGAGANRPLARLSAMRSALQYMRDGGWRDFCGL